MQLVNSRTDVKTNIGNNRVEFGISKDSAKLFSMLSSSLYSNKEAAVLYELGANCLDAHILNGNVDKPWDLTMPTSLDAHIRFRDYGPGLDEDSVYRLLTTYGESTKSGSNVAIGAFGLGSKSPAAVTSTWNIISRCNGELKEYFIVVDANGIPSMTRIRYEEKNTDPSGLEVVIPVNPNRIFSWNDNLKTVFKHYTVKPNIKNYNVTWITPTKVVLQGTDWNLGPSTYYRNNIKFITTQREYGVDRDVLRAEMKNEPFLELLGMDIEVHFPVGELETSLSREQLQYTKHTLNSIRTKLSRIYTEIKSRVDTHLASATDALHYRQLVVEASKNILGYNDISSSSIFAFIKGNKYGVSRSEDLSHFNVEVSAAALGGLEMKLCNGKSTTKFTTGTGCWKTYAIILNSNHNSVGNLTYNIRFKIAFLDRISIVLADVRGASARVKYKLGQGTGKFALITNEHAKFPTELQRFIVRASSLPKPPAASRVIMKSNIWMIKKNSFIRVDESTIDKKSTVVVVEFDDARTIGSIPQMQKSMLQILKDHGREVTVIAVKNGKKIPKYAKSIEDHILTDFDKLNTTQFVEEKQVADFKHKLDVSYDPKVKFLSTIRNMDKTAKANTVWNEVHDELSKILSMKGNVKTSNDYAYIYDISRLIKVPLKTTTGVTLSIDNIQQKLYNAYKMLKHMDYTSVAKKDVLEYVELVGI
jgi:hypothetical protein